MSANIAPFLKSHMHDQNGEPLVGGKIFSYIAGSTTLLTTFADESGTEPNPNPLILDANGEYEMFLKDHYYKFVIKDANDVVLRTIARIKGQSEAGDTAENISSLGVGPFYAPQINGAVKDELFGFEVFRMSQGSDQIVNKVITVPDNFANGPITLKASYFTAALLGATRFELKTTLISKFDGQAISDQMPTRTEILNIDLSVAEGESDTPIIIANLLRTANFNVCDVDNLGAHIDGSYIKARDQMKVEIKRLGGAVVVPADTPEEINFMQHGSEERFS